MTLTKRSSTFVKYYFPCEKPEGGGSSYNKWKLFAVCLINKADKLPGFSLYLLVGSQAFLAINRQRIMLFSIIVLAFSSGFEAHTRDGVCAERQAEVNRSSSQSSVCCGCKKVHEVVNPSVFLMVRPCSATCIQLLFYCLSALED